jgi:azurin
MNLKGRTLLASAATAFVLTASFSAAAPGAARVITIKGNDEMKFDVVSIKAAPGEQVQVKVVTTGKIPKVVMAHNFVLLKKGTNAKAFADEAMKATPASSYIPAALKAQVVAFTGLAGPGETVQVTFTVPKVPGRYEFICTFPGHYAAGMKGVFVVAAKTTS